MSRYRITETRQITFDLPDDWDADDVFELDDEVADYARSLPALEWDVLEAEVEPL